MKKKIVLIGMVFVFFVLNCAYAEAKAAQALLVIDVQNEYFTGKLPVTYPPKSLKNVLKAMDAATKKGVPVVIIQHSAQGDFKVFKKPTEEWLLHPEVAKRPHSVVIEKTFPGSFTKTELGTWLKQHAIDTVTISGYMTQMCCDTTARQAMHLGYAVNFLSDATGTLDVKNAAGTIGAEELHKAVLTVQNSRFSKVMTTDEWIEGL